MQDLAHVVAPRRRRRGPALCEKRTFADSPRTRPATHRSAHRHHLHLRLREPHQLRDLARGQGRELHDPGRSRSSNRSKSSSIKRAAEPVVHSLPEALVLVRPRADRIGHGQQRDQVEVAQRRPDRGHGRGQEIASRRSRPRVPAGGGVGEIVDRAPLEHDGRARSLAADGGDRVVEERSQPLGRGAFRRAQRDVIGQGLVGFGLVAVLGRRSTNAAISVLLPVPWDPDTARRTYDFFSMSAIAYLSPWPPSGPCWRGLRLLTLPPWGALTSSRMLWAC